MATDDESDGRPITTATDPESRLAGALRSNVELRTLLSQYASATNLLKTELERLVSYSQAQDDVIKDLTDKLTHAAKKADQFNQFVSKLTYNADGIATTSKNTEFLLDSRFRRAYKKGMASGHRINYLSDPENDLHIEWRVAIALWAATYASRLPGDFVECGTYTGILSLAICDYLDFGNLEKQFYLFDTFEGVPLEQVGESEDRDVKEQVNLAWYAGVFEIAKRNFLPYSNVHLVRGIVPDSLESVEIGSVSYLSLDMNIAYPERAALEYFWPRLVPGGIIVFDDYGFAGHESQKRTHDEFARLQGVEIFTLPTGQGLLLKPPA